MNDSPSTNPTVEETATTNDGIIFDMTTPEVSNEPATVETGQVADLSASSPAPITEPTTTANESLVTDITPEISTSPLDSLAADPIEMDLPEIKPDPVPSTEPVATTDPLDIFGAEIQNTETNNNEDPQPKQATDDLGFLDAFG